MRMWLRYQINLWNFQLRFTVICNHIYRVINSAYALKSEMRAPLPRGGVDKIVRLRVKNDTCGRNIRIPIAGYSNFESYQQ